MKPHEWSIGRRLAAGFGLVIAALAVFAVATLAWHRQSHKAQGDYVQRIAPRADATLDLERTLFQVTMATRAHLLVPGPKQADRTAEAVEEARKALGVLAELPKEDDGARLFRNLEPAVANYLDEALRVTRLAGLASSTASEASLAQARLDALAQVHAFSDLQRAKARLAIQAMEESRERVAAGLVATFAVVVGLLLALGVLTSSSIRGRTRQLRRIAREMQSGNWRPAIELSPRAAAARGESLAPQDEFAQIALAFGSAAEALERRELRLRADARVAQAATASLDKAQIAEQALRAMAECTGATVGAVYWSAPGGELSPIATRALAHAPRTLAMGEGIPGQAAKEGRVVVLSDIPPDTPMRLELGLEEVAPRSVIALPAMLRGEVLGVVVLAALRPPDEVDLEFLESATLQLAIGLANVRSHEQVQRLVEELRESGERVRAQNEQLQAQAEELQAQGEELQAQNEQLQLRTSELAQMDTRKNQFLGLLAHELRNPLAAIANSLFILERGALGGALGGEQESRSLAVIQRQMRYLTRLIDDLLDVTRISHGKLQLKREPLDIAGLARESVNDCRLAAEKAGIRLEDAIAQEPVYVLGDRTRLAQVLGNLVSNALKFTREGGRIAVAVEQAAPGQVAVRVADDGMGIEPQLLERLFQPFSQGEGGLARGNGGLGLGLALAKALVELHQGTIQVRSEGEGRGTEFVVTLPVTSARPAAPAPAASQRAAPRIPRRIVLVEDNEDAAESLRVSLEMEGHEVSVAATGPEGVERARALVPDVVLCDLGIPGIDGFEVARRLRADPRLASTTLVALSGYATAEDRARTREAGFDDHLAKPVEMQALLERLARPAGPAAARGRAALA